jgi:gluconolactonase
MTSRRMLAVALGVLGTAAAAFCQGTPQAPRTGPGVQAAQDAREPEVLAGCKNPPPARGGARGPAATGPARANTPQPAGPKDYTVTAIPGVIAAGLKWKEVWEVSGNNADGIIGTADGGLLIAQNDKSEVVKLDVNGKAMVAFTGTNTGGAVSMSSKGVLFLNDRGLNPAVVELAPERKTFANRYQGDPLDCLGGVLNDLMADSKGGVYFTTGGLFYADSKGVITKYGENLRTNGIILSPDEKTLFVTNGMTLAAFDVQGDGSLTNQRQFAMLEGGGGGDGSTVDDAGRIYVSSNAGVHVIGPNGRYLGLIPTPRGIISAAFSGPDKKMLYVVARDNAMNEDWILGIQMISQGFKGRAK